MVNESLFEMSGTGGAWTYVDDGPRFMFGNLATYQTAVKNIAKRLGMEVDNWMIDMSKELEKHDTEPPKGPPSTVSYYQTGDPDSENVGTDYHPEVSKDKARDLWIAHAKDLVKKANDVKVVDIMMEGVEKGETENSRDDLDDNGYQLIEGGYESYIKTHFDLELLVDTIREDIPDELEKLLDEATYKDLRSQAPDFLNVRDKSDRMSTRYVETTEEGVVVYKTRAVTGQGTYDQYIKLLQLDEFIEKYSGTKKPIQIVRMALAGDIKVHCTDPSWLYWGFQHKGTKEDYALYPEKRFPKIRNPQLEGSVCKHLDVVLYTLPFQSGKVLKDLQVHGRL